MPEPERLHLLPALVASVLLSACQSDTSAAPPTSGASVGAGLAGGCAAVTDPQISTWVGAPQEVEQISAGPLTCHGVHREIDDWIDVTWTFDEHQPEEATLDLERAPWLVVLHAPAGEQGLHVTVRNDSASRPVPVPRLARIARKVAEAYR